MGSRRRAGAGAGAGAGAARRLALVGGVAAARRGVGGEQVVEAVGRPARRARGDDAPHGRGGAQDTPLHDLDHGMVLPRACQERAAARAPLGQLAVGHARAAQFGPGQRHQVLALALAQEVVEHEHQRRLAQELRGRAGGAQGGLRREGRSRRPSASRRAVRRRGKSPRRDAFFLLRLLRLADVSRRVSPSTAFRLLPLRLVVPRVVVPRVVPAFARARNLKLVGGRLGDEALRDLVVERKADERVPDERLARREALRAPRSRGALFLEILFLEIFVVCGVAGDVERHRFSPARFAGRQHERVRHEPIHSKPKSVRARKREENAPPGPARARARVVVVVVVRLFCVPAKRRGRVRGRVARDADSASRGPPERLAEGRDHLHHRAGEVQAGNLRRRRFVGDGDFFFFLIQERRGLVVARRLPVFAGRVRSVLLRVRPGEQREAETRVHLVHAGLASHRGAFGTGAGEPRRGSPLGVARKPPPFAAAALEVQGTRLGVAVAGAVPEEPPLHVGARLRAARVARAREPRRVSARARGDVRGRGAAPHHGGVVPVPDVHVPSRLRDRGLARGRPHRVSARAPVGQTPRGRSRASVVRGDLQGRARATVRAVQGLARRARAEGRRHPARGGRGGLAGAAAHGRGRLA